MSTRTTKQSSPPRGFKKLILDHFPSAVLIAIALIIAVPNMAAPLIGFTLQTVGGIPGWIGTTISSLAEGISSIRLDGGSSLAPLFTREIDHWGSAIDRWAQQHNLDPNLLATVMQIESCGHPTIASYAGAQGLFQVMPFHFTAGENQLDPDTNALRGANFLNVCLEMSNGDTGLALACYNGGPSVLRSSYPYWDGQVQRYFTWGTGIYADAVQNSASSATLDRWLAAGGGSLCQMAAAELGIE